MTQQTVNISPVELGRFLAKLRSRADMLQGDLAKRSQLSTTILSRIESGSRSVSLEEVIDILNNIPTDEAAMAIQALQRQWDVLPMPPIDHDDQELLWESEQVVRKLEGILVRPDVSQAFARRIFEYRDEIRRCVDLLLKRDHQVAFIGPIGIGKSTGICYMTNMVVPLEDGTHAPVLADGSGGTTLCEVHLVVGPEYGISIEPSTSDEIREDVRDFVDYLLKGATSPAEEGARAPDAQGTSKELQRAIRNMADLSIKGPRDGTGKRADPAKALVSQHPTTRDLVAEVLTRMALPARDRRQLWYDSASGKTPLAWIREQFRRVNNGTHPEFTLPKRIDVIVKEPLIQANGLVVRLVDTKGIDQTVAREDIEVHLKDPHTLAVICSAFNEAPGLHSVQLLQRALDAGARTLERNACVMVLPKHREALAMTDDATGMPVESVQEGYDLKREHAEMNMASLRIEDFRIGFYNCHADAPTTAQTFIVEGIERARDSFRQQLEGALSGARNMLDNQDQEAAQAALAETAERIRVWLHEVGGTPNFAGSVNEDLLDQMRIVHAASIHAAARRSGDWKNFSYSYQLGFGARKLCVRALGRAIDGFADFCKVERGSTELKAVHELVAQALRVLEYGFGQLQTKVQTMAQGSYLDELKQAEDLWQNCINEWGQRRGYREAVAKYSQNWLSDDIRVQIESEIKDTILREWSRVLQSLRELLGESQSSL